MDKWAFGFLVGHFLSIQSPILLNWTFIVALVLIVMAIHLNVWQQQKQQFALFISGFLVASVLVFTHGQLFYQNQFIEKINQTYLLEGTVSSRLMPFEFISSSDIKPSMRFKFQVERIIDNNDSEVISQTTPFVFLTWYKPKVSLQYGDKIRVHAKLNESFGYRNQFGFDYRQWAFSKNIYAKGYIVGEVTRLTKPKSITNSKQSVYNQMVALTHGLKSQPYLLALLLGDKSQLSYQQKSLLNQAGISHIFAISGLHIGIVFFYLRLLFTLLLKRFSSHNKHHVLSLLPLICIWGYVYLLDGVISAQRAALFVSLWVLMGLLYVNISQFKRLLYIAVLSLIFEPWAILQSSWWLSFTAVFGILLFIARFSYLNQNTQAEANNERKFSFQLIHYRLKVFFFFQMFIWFWMLPVTVYWFAGFSLSGLVINLVVVPLFCIVLIPYLFIVSFVSLSCLNVFPLIEGGSLLSMLFVPLESVILWLISFLEQNSWTHIWITVANGIWMFLLLCIVFVLMYQAIVYESAFKRAFKQQTLLYSSVCSTFFLCMFYFFALNKSENSEPLEMRMMDVGQGTSIVFKRNNNVFIYDLGPVYKSGYSATSVVVKPTLVGLGINELDLLVISHQDSDHKGDISAIYPFISSNTKQYTSSCPNQTMYWQNTMIMPISPLLLEPFKNEIKISDNDKSCVLKVVDLISGYSVLLTGDISKNIELALVNLNNSAVPNILKSDVLISAHHGSKYSSSYQFLKAVEPDIVLHSAGLNNRFGFPTDEVQARITKLGISQLSSAEHGEIIMQFGTKNNDETFVIETKVQLNDWQPFWKKQNPFSIRL